MKPADRPCYFCGEAKKAKTGKTIGRSTYRTALSRFGCGSITFHTILEETENVPGSKYLAREDRERLNVWYG